MEPCPFCGNASLECVEEWQSHGLHDGGYAWVVRCNYLAGGCGAKGGIRLEKEEAIEAWNKRVEQNVFEGTSFKRK